MAAYKRYMTKLPRDWEQLWPNACIEYRSTLTFPLAGVGM